MTRLSYSLAALVVASLLFLMGLLSTGGYSFRTNATRVSLLKAATFQDTPDEPHAVWAFGTEADDALAETLIASAQAQNLPKWVGALLLAEQRPDDAQRALSDAVAAGDVAQNELALFYLGEAELQLGDTESGLGRWEAVGAREPLELYAQSLMDEGASDEDVIAALEALGRVAPTRAWLWRELGGLYEAQGNFAVSAERYRQFAQLVPDFPVGYGLTGGALLQQGEYVAAIAEFEQAMTKNPANPAWLLAGLAESYHLNGQLEQAKSAYLQLLEADPARVGVYQTLGQLSCDLDQPSDALNFYTTALNEGGASAELERLISEIQTTQRCSSETE